MALKPAVDVVSRQAHRSGVIVSGACPPLLGVEHIDNPNRRQCRNFNDAIIAMLKQDGSKITTVILISRWVLWATGEYPKEEGGRHHVIKDDLSTNPLISDNLNVFSRGLKRTVEELNRLGLSVVILGNVPEIGWNVPVTLAKAKFYGRPIPSSPTLNQALQRSAVADRVIAELAKTFDLKFVSLDRILCQSNCKVVHEGHSMYWDNDHISRYGARNFLGPALMGKIW